MTRLVLAAALVVSGFTVLASAAAVLGWRRWLGVDSSPPLAEHPQLVVRGPFGLVRHPQTLGWLCVLLGGALWWPTPWIWFAAVVAALLLVLRARVQEAGMARRWGEAYARYRRAVPFLLPCRW